MSKKIKYAIILATVVLLAGAAKFILYYNSTELKIIRSYNNNSELYAKLVDDLNDHHKNADYDFTRLEIGWDNEDKQSNTTMRTDLVHKDEIDENIYNDLALAMDTIDTSGKMYIQTYFDEEKVRRMEISITEPKCVEDGETWIYYDELVYYTSSFEDLYYASNKIIRSEPIAENWYYVKVKGSAG